MHELRRGRSGGASNCPQCGVFARVADPERHHGRGWRYLLLLLLIAIVAAGAAYFLMPRSAAERPRSGPVRVVHDRPGGARIGAGATISEAEAIVRLRRSLDLKPDCIAILSHGFRRGAYDLLAVNRCDGTRLGRWRVDGKSGAVSRPEPGK